jgi:hypothetical protein
MWISQRDFPVGVILDIMEISKIISIQNYRSPYGITRRLLEKKYTTEFRSARGYTLYITTPEYKTYMEELMRGLGGGTAYSN